jgi:CBS domain-containing protein
LKEWECYRCSHSVKAENPPDECPNCHYSVTFWLSRAQEQPLTLKDFVRTSVLKLDAGISVWEAAKLMKENDTENALVTVNGELLGMMTEKDILYKVAAEDLSPSKTPIRNVMSSSLVFAPSDTPMTDALKIMAEHHIRRIIVTEGGRPIGIVSHRSIVGGSFRRSKEQTKRGDVSSGSSAVA